MADIREWEQRLQRELDEIRRSSRQLSEAVGSVRGRCQLQGLSVEVDANGNITDLQIAPGALRWTSEQLSRAIRSAHRKARADATARIENLVRRCEPRIREQFELLADRESTPPEPPPHRPMTEAEIQAADDAYFERMNRGGWTQ
ncbi:hypothetical protein C5E45_23045 [Nocardia nova]|uniref:YbaB/EbfC family DNA-binding protein n=1 Tax=Nocardia nova TaxID=37330 RepID=A0A2S6AL71_9NOCA|nr:YbaB/EbfC family nucleoid-associated protein [Nocardia nova]PPJ31740.1 hypothetical protein C5E41_07585 [Nocardia nova]PPJ35979.1 hypothetical protein C5E45_23045 [Nocardia nova]